MNCISSLDRSWLEGICNLNFDKHSILMSCKFLDKKIVNYKKTKRYIELVLKIFNLFDN